MKIYSPAKSVTICFRLRNRLGIDVAVEALRTGLDERKFTMARRCRVASAVRPSLEALQ